MHIILDIKKSNFTKYIANDYSLYVRILGFFKESSNILSIVDSNAKIPVISKLADCEQVIENSLTLKLLFETLNASELYLGLVSSRYGCEYVSELSQKIVIL